MKEDQDKGPFPIRDSEILEEYSEQLIKGDYNYDNEPVVACPNCNSLNLRTEDGKLECFKCGHEINEKDVVVYKDIFAYIESESSSD
jgi:DNA-directed RNA polymerase subunit RPC12/RpoP